MIWHSRPTPVRKRAMPSSGFCVADRPMRCSGAGEVLEALQRQREVRAALVAGQGVDLVDDHRAHRSQHLPPADAGQQDGERFRGGDQDVRRLAQHLRALGRGGVAAAHQHADVGHEAVLRADARERHLQVLLDVVAERLERRHVQHLAAVGQVRPLLHQGVERGQEGRQGLAGAGRRGDQHAASGADRRPALRLRRGRGADAGGEPGLHGGMEGGQGHRVHYDRNPQNAMTGRMGREQAFPAMGERRPPEQGPYGPMR